MPSTACLVQGQLGANKALAFDIVNACSGFVYALAALTVTFGSDSSPAAKPVTIPLPQDELAELVGGTRPSVNQVLRRFVDEGMLELSRGRIVVTDAAALRRAASH